jgi:alpha-methylacyl-CoA racemase
LAGHDLNYISYAGILGITGNPDEAPMMPGVQLADIAGGSYMSVIATLSAMHARTQTGVGQHVDVSMTDAVMPLLSVSYASYSATLQAQVRGTLPLSGGMPNYGVYVCQDKKYIALGTLEAKFWSKFCDLTNKPDWKMFMVPQNTEQLQSFKNLIGGLFLEKNQSEWIQFGFENDLLISPVYGLEDLGNDPHLLERQMIIETEHPTAGKLKSIGVPIKFSETEAKHSWAAPLLGEDTEAILRELFE